jgi:S1-C subfamily serine protease
MTIVRFNAIKETHMADPPVYPHTDDIGVGRQQTIDPWDTGGGPSEGLAREQKPQRRNFGFGAIAAAALVGALTATGVTLGVLEFAAGDEPQQAALPPSIEVAGEANGIIPAVAEAVTPSVVHIAVEGVGPQQVPFGQPRSGVGSGVIYREDGYVLTNNHVVEGAEAVQVRLSSGESLDAEVIGTDPLNDLAVLRVDAEGLPPITIRPEDDPVVVGETVVAIGSPFGLEGSVTSGIVSALNRDLPVPDEQAGVIQTIPSVIQTDAAINPGNSGGALVDIQGRLIGLNTAILSGTGANQGVGFAVPAGQVISSADQLIEQGFVRHALLGVAGRDITPALAEQFGMETTRGAVVEDVQEGTGAHEAGLQADDIIVEVDGAALATMSELVAHVRAKKPGEDMNLVVIRDGERLEFSVTLGERPR